MKFFADLHIHSRFSRATGRDVCPDNLWKWAKIKGISVLGTGDFTHPGWFNELKEKLDIHDNNLFTLKDNYKINTLPQGCTEEVYFMLTAEVSCIYTKKEKVRKIHCLILAPDFTAAAELNRFLSKIGNLSSDGRPILGLDAKTLLKTVLCISEDILLIPAHAWTPHFSVFGAASGFDSLDECFDELTPHIHAIETGLSSNPAMNRRLSALDHITLVSNSDAHSPAKLGREANILDTEISYSAIINAMKTGKGFAGTVEFFSEEGKYHYDGHRSCGVRLSPEETIRHNYLCPVCGRKVTIGVMHRIEKLADRQENYHLPGAHPFHSIIPLMEILAEIKKIGVNSKAVNSEYFRLIEVLGSELSILIDLELEEIGRAESPLLKEAISRMRSGNVNIAPGFDGEYGKVKIFEEPEQKEIKGQRILF
jgi:uncharacterized protein (TIGR00375 family)